MIHTAHASLRSRELAARLLAKFNSYNAARLADAHLPDDGLRGRQPPLWNASGRLAFWAQAKKKRSARMFSIVCTQHLRWSVITDGVTRRLPEFRSAGAAAWEDGKLELRMIGPGSHRETAVAFIRDGRLIVDGQTERGAYHSEFRRIDP